MYPALTPVETAIPVRYWEDKTHSIMDTLDKLFALQKSLSSDLSQVQKQLHTAKSPAAKVILKSKYSLLYKLHQQVCDMVLPY
ncbi:hypothetical protein DSL64_21485 [Dyadobacter luteus]|uniref:Uncharacterized protein n=2 Tax=Dyadobacter luteus TaxID=2259619 RepID=A0A3D8Y638_9BACT|nr:hypothetical protein DSL64_21485 [Dyadobacter luteus]